MQTSIPACCFAAISSTLTAGIAQAQPPMFPVGARLTFEVAHPGGPWSSSVAAKPGDRIEWRAKVSYTGDNPSVDALGSIYYQPIISNADNTGDGSSIDQLGTWRNGGISGIGNTNLRPGMLNASEGESSSALESYGRVRFGFTSRSNTAGSSGALMGHRHSGGSDGAPTGSFIRIAGNRSSTWYLPEMPHDPSVTEYNIVLAGVTSDSPSRTGSLATFFQTGTQDLVIFRQSLILSEDNTDIRTLNITSEAASLRRISGSGGVDDTRFMNWMVPSDAGTGPSGSILVGVEYVSAQINVVPSPASAILPILGGLAISRRRRAIRNVGA